MKNNWKLTEDATGYTKAKFEPDRWPQEKNIFYNKTKQVLVYYNIVVLNWHKMIKYMSLAIYLVNFRLLNLGIMNKWQWFITWEAKIDIVFKINIVLTNFLINIDVTIVTPIKFVKHFE